MEGHEYSQLSQQNPVPNWFENHWHGRLRFYTSFSPKLKDFAHSKVIFEIEAELQKYLSNIFINYLITYIIIIVR